MVDITLTDARNRLLQLAEEIDEEPDTIVQVTKRGRRVLAILSARRLDALLETIEVLADEPILRRLRRARAERDAGETVSWTEAKKRLGLDR
jgi:PHD/YefM family antitoxin component YafN of YafNO toxin-antitoxin module